MDRHRKSIVIFFLCAFVLLLASCQRQSDANPVENETAAVNMRQIDSAFNIAASFPGLKSLIVARGDTILREQYFGYGRADITEDVRSVTKSVVALLIGIAVDKGYIGSPDDPMKQYLNAAGYSVPSNKEHITIRHLLTMSSGIPWVELQGPSEYSTWTSSPDQVKYMLDKTPEAPPGQYFNYNSGASHLLSVILTQAAGMSTLAFADSFLFKPLGITSRSWSRDKKGYYYGSAALSVTARDILKIGRLILGNGMYQGNRIISSSYVREATDTQISTRNVLPYGSGYGYCIWTGTDHNRPFSFAMGYGGQFIIVIPHLDVAVVALNEWRSGDASAQWMQTINLIMLGILPAFYN